MEISTQPELNTSTDRFSGSSCTPAVISIFSCRHRRSALAGWKGYTKEDLSALSANGFRNLLRLLAENMEPQPLLATSGIVSKLHARLCSGRQMFYREIFKDVTRLNPTKLDDHH